MSSFDLTRRRVFQIAPCALALSACGFTPVYAPGEAATQLQGTVLYQEPKTPDQFDIARHIEQRLGVATAPKFGLVIIPRVRSESLAVAAEEDITRFDLIGIGNYTLTDLRTGQAIQSGQVDTFTSYSATGTTVSTLSAQREARSRLMVALTDLVLVRLIATADTLPA